MKSEQKQSKMTIKSVSTDEIRKMNLLMEENNLHTVCKEANCPNAGECFKHKTATFLILGDVCTRNCRFCNISAGKPKEVDLLEPNHIIRAIRTLDLEYVVVTSVTRDDLQDGGASQFVEVVKCIRRMDRKVNVELLIPDFRGDTAALDTVIQENPNVLGHNIETVERLHKTICPGSDYQLSLHVLGYIKEKNPAMLTKTGIMVGLGETTSEVVETMKDIRKMQCDILTIGQYLQPSRKHAELVEYVSADLFEDYKKMAYDLGFKYVESAPFVRSSYHSGVAYKTICMK